MTSFWNLLSGKVEYSRQWEAWEKLCEQYGVDGKIVLGLLNRAHDAMDHDARKAKWKERLGIHD